MALLEENHQSLPMHQQGGRPQSPFSFHLSSDTSCCSAVFETPVSLEDEQTQTYSTPPPIQARTEGHNAAAITDETEMSKHVLHRKRLRPCYRRKNALPPMIPGSPELYNKSESNPFRRHIPIHSPIARIGNTLNLEYIGTLGTTKSRHGSQPLQPDSASSDECGDTFRFQAFIPLLEDSYDDDDVRFIDGNEGEYKTFGIASRALKRRRSPCN